MIYVSIYLPGNHTVGGTVPWSKRLARLIVRRRIELVLFCDDSHLSYDDEVGAHHFDFTSYLSEATHHDQAVATLMEKEFGKSGQLRIMFENLRSRTCLLPIDTMNAMGEVTLVLMT
jgi:hypothetical protein